MTELGSTNATIKAIFHAHEFHSSTKSIARGQLFGIVLNRTCFYAESGGQESDTGTILLDSDEENQAEFRVANVQVFTGYVLHVGYLVEDVMQMEVGQEVIATYDEVSLTTERSLNHLNIPQERRRPIKSNHTATHILNYALREVLGDHIDQKGSLVAANKLRFDFSHKSAVTQQQMQDISSIALDWIKRNVRVSAKELSLKEAQAIPGLRAVFGEAYPDPVRVVALQYDVDEMSKDITNPKWRSTSVEFCGGT